MRKDELIEITKLIHAIFPESNAETIIKKDDKVIVAEVDGKRAGFIHLSHRRDFVLVECLGVIRDFRSKGVGSALLSSLPKSDKPFYLKASPGNETALALYEKEGFVVKPRSGSKSERFLILVRMPEN